MGRKKLPKNKARSILIPIRMTKEEKTELNNYVKKHKIKSVSAYIRNLIKNNK